MNGLNAAYFLFFLIYFMYLAVLSCSTWDLVPQPRIKPQPPALGMQNLSHWTTSKVPIFS